MVATEDANLNKFDDDPSRHVKEYTLRKYGNFLHDYASSLAALLQQKTNLGDIWEISKNPIALEYFPEESAGFSDLVDTEDAAIKKIMVTFASLCHEMQLLEEEATLQFFSHLLLYGEGVSSASNDNSYFQVGRMMPLLKNIHTFVERCKEVVKNCIQQIALFHDGEMHLQKKFDCSGVRIAVVYEHLGRLFRVLAMLDHIVEHQTVLREHWKLYKRMMKGVRLGPESFGSSHEEVELINKLNSDLESCVLQGKMFEATMKQNFESTDIQVSKNSSMSNGWLMHVRQNWIQIDSKTMECGCFENTEGNQLLECMCLYIAHSNLFQTIDRKLFKTLWDSYKKIPCVVIAGSSALYPQVFLLEKLPQMKTTINQKAVQLEASNRNAWLQKSLQSLSSYEQGMESLLKGWVMKLESCFTLKPTENFNESLNVKCRIFLQGLEIARKLRSSSSVMFVLHASLQKPMSKSTVLSACRLMENLKILSSSFYRWSLAVSEALTQISQYIAMLSLSIVGIAHKRMKSDKKVGKESFMVLGLLGSCFSGPATRERVILTKLAVGMCQQQKLFKDEELQCLQQCISDVEVLNNFNSELLQQTDCSFIYWHKVTFNVYLSGISESPFECYRLKYFLQAVEDCRPFIEGIHHSSSPSLLAEDFQNFIVTQLEENYLIKICREIETDLRLNTHTHLKLDPQNPFKNAPKHLLRFIKASPLRVFGRLVDVKTYVENYLNKTFYNLTTVALHDWKTYSEMKIWANQKYSLRLLEPHLPSQTLEQGLDILEIMRNIHLFVSKYLYNLNNQIFVEKCSNNKHFNTINIKHTANSIRTHGVGIMNTAVNFTYQFLAKKFYIFSQFLYDEHIKSRLIKDLKFFRENHVKSNHKYPFERAEKFQRSIKRLGVTNEGLTYLDQFRLLISEIGNAMGYVRLVRSGGLHCCSNAIRFVPDIEDVVSFEELCKEDSLSDECTRSAKLLDDVISNMIKHFSEGTDYFKMLVDVFSPEFKDPKNIHLKNFFVTLPPLTLNFVEHMINSKEKLNKKNKIGAAFTDDGFAMGVAYILKLLDQYNEFDSFHWFQSVREKYQKEKDDLLKLPTSSKDEKLKQTANLTLKRIENYKQEFELLYFSLSSARIFFRADQHTEEREEKSSTEGSIKEEQFSSP